MGQHWAFNLRGMFLCTQEGSVGSDTIVQIGPEAFAVQFIDTIVSFRSKLNIISIFWIEPTRICLWQGW